MVFDLAVSGDLLFKAGLGITMMPSLHPWKISHGYPKMMLWKMYLRLWNKWRKRKCAWKIPETLSRDLSNKRTRITNPWHTCKRVLHTLWKNCAFAGEGSTIWNDDRVSSEIFVHWKLRLLGWLGWLGWWEAWKVGAGDASLSSSQIIWFVLTEGL